MFHCIGECVNCAEARLAALKQEAGESQWSLKLTERSLKLTERSLKMTERSLKLTEHSLKLTERSLKMTERSTGVCVNFAEAGLAALKEEVGETHLVARFATNELTATYEAHAEQQDNILDQVPYNIRSYTYYMVGITRQHTVLHLVLHSWYHTNTYSPTCATWLVSHDNIRSSMCYMVGITR
jgi:hypothetical protein